MSVSTSDRQVIDDLVRAMQIGPAAENDLLGLFAEDGVLVEPFTGQMQTHNGKPAIKASLTQMWTNRAPDMKLMLDRVDMQGKAIRAEWTCTSSVMPGPMKGYDLFQIQQGKIKRLEIFVTQMPGFPGQ